MTSNNESPKQYALCDHCDLLSELPDIASQHKAVCPRCYTRLARGRDNMKKNTIIFSCSALIMLMLACGFVFINIRVVGIINNLNLLAIPRILLQDQYTSLMLLFLILVIALPIISLVIQIILCSYIPVSKYRKRDLLIIYDKLHTWCMPEIFMAGVIVSFVKLTSYGDVGVNQAFWAFCLFIVFYLKSSIDFSTQKIWNEITTNDFSNKQLVSGKRGIDQNVRLCQCCHAILSMDYRCCPRCKKKGKMRDKSNLQWTIALLITSLILYIPANVFGVMNTVFFGSTSSSTILDGVVYMWKEGDYPVALVIFTASVVIPVLKIISLSWLCYFVLVIRHKHRRDRFKMNRLFNIVEFIGRWSMIDIFVVSVVSTLIKNGEMMTVYPDIGAIYFASVVIITMVAAHKYDPRLIWDKN